MTLGSENTAQLWIVLLGPRVLVMANPLFVKTQDSPSAQRGAKAFSYAGLQPPSQQLASLTGREAIHRCCECGGRPPQPQAVDGARGPVAGVDLFCFVSDSAASAVATHVFFSKRWTGFLRFKALGMSIIVSNPARSERTDIGCRVSPGCNCAVGRHALVSLLEAMNKLLFP